MSPICAVFKCVYQLQHLISITGSLSGLRHFQALDLQIASKPAMRSKLPNVLKGLLRYYLGVLKYSISSVILGDMDAKQVELYS